ncbi:hypothetical protein BH10PSE17_BH10PSE17_13210 [soil metagenome]
MELDDFSQAWRAFDARLDRQADLTRQLFVECRLDRVRSGLRPLLIGQCLQALVGLAIAIVSGSFWVAHFDVPQLRWAGLSVHAFAIAMIVMAVPAILVLLTIDYSKPVVTLQRQLAMLRVNQRRSAILFAYAGCVIWVPLMMMVAKIVWGLDLFHAPAGYLGWNLLFAAVLVLLLAGFFQWSAMPGREALRARIERSRHGWTVNRASAAADEIERFSRDDAA